MPSHASTSASPAASASPTPSRDVSRCAVAAGATMSVNTSSTPTTCAHSAVATAATARNSTETSRSFTPFASASSGCRLANSSGRERTASAARDRAPRPSKVQIVPASTPSTLPNSSAVACDAKAVKKCRNSRPSPSERASTTPIATSLCASRSPSNPIPTPAATVSATSPHSGGAPTSTAPVAPANPTCASACPANAWPRNTRKKPTNPATTATTAAAANALTMKSYANIEPASIVPALVPLHRVGAGHHEDAPSQSDDLDLRAV
jgi:hypothetical protein